MSQGHITPKSPHRAQYPVSGKFQFRSDSRFNYLATIWFRLDSENP